MNYFIRFLLVLLVFGTLQTRAQITILNQSLLTEASYNLFIPVSVIGSQTWTYSLV